jgi:hypothetical protein
MTYWECFEQTTGKTAPQDAARLEPLFVQIAAGEKLPPRAQQAVDLGLPAHSLNDAKTPLYQYYHWVMVHCFSDRQPNELTAKLIGMAFVCNRVFQTDLPQPLTLNPWQIERMAEFPLATQQAVVVENNGVFALLAQLHPQWPLINQGGNDFQPAYVTLMQRLVVRGVRMTYLGDLDARGIQMADTLYQQLDGLALDDFLALQTSVRVSAWLATHGIASSKRTRQLTVTTPALQQQMNAVVLSGQYVEQEQLIADYEALIEAWLK